VNAADELSGANILLKIPTAKLAPQVPLSLQRPFMLAGSSFTAQEGGDTYPAGAMNGHTFALRAFESGA
jgi:hypothetical protein